MTRVGFSGSKPLTLPAGVLVMYQMEAQSSDDTRSTYGIVSGWSKLVQDRARDLARVHVRERREERQGAHTRRLVDGCDQAPPPEPFGQRETRIAGTITCCLDDLA